VSEEANLVRGLAGDWSTPEFEVDFEVLHGSHAATAIIDYVACQPDVVLVAMATHGVPAQARVVSPSQTFRVVRRALCPVIALHPLPELIKPERRNVVVAGVDDSERSNEVIVVAAEEAKARGAKLLLVHTWQEPFYAGPDFTGMYGTPDLTALETAQTDILDEALTHARQLVPDVDVIGSVTRGRIADVLVDYSRSAELVVVGSHYHGAFAEAMLGSISSSVGRRSSCPVIVVPCPAPVR
jgi:nucleotide-binding universal stress UspA family protein